MYSTRAFLSSRSSASGVAMFIGQCLVGLTIAYVALAGLSAVGAHLRAFYLGRASAADFYMAYASCARAGVSVAGESTENLYRCTRLPEGEQVLTLKQIAQRGIERFGGQLDVMARYRCKAIGGSRIPGAGEARVYCELGSLGVLDLQKAFKPWRIMDAQAASQNCTPERFDLALQPLSYRCAGGELVSTEDLAQRIEAAQAKGSAS